MLPRDIRYSRRRFLASAAALTVGAGATAGTAPTAAKTPIGNRRPIAVLGTVYRPLSYLYHLAGRFLHGTTLDGQPWMPEHAIQSLWVEQAPENDLSRLICNKFGIRRARTVSDALLHNGQLAVDGVMIVAEHGNYPRNERGQVLYPKAALFRQVAEAFEKAGKTAPIFVSRQLSHSFDQANEMVCIAERMGIPLMAGTPFFGISTTPPRSELRNGPISDVLVAGFGPLELFGFDAFALMQSLLGQCPPVVSVRCLVGNEVWRAGDRGEWNWGLLHAALTHAGSLNLGDVRDNVGSIALPGMPATPPMAILMEFANGTRGAGLLLNGHLQETVAGIRYQDGSEFSCGTATGAAPGLRHFDAHAAAIDRFFSTREPKRPAREELMCTAVLERIMQSHAEGGRTVATPELAAL